jgi:hypothetical protein
MDTTQGNDIPRAIKSLPLANFTLQRMLGIAPHVTITNASNKKAWVILSPVPIVSISSMSIDKLGSISFSTSGDYQCQQFLISPNKSTEYELDTSQIYYSVFFEFGDVWKTPFKNRRLNTRKYNINLLERHVENSVDASLLPA